MDERGVTFRWKDYRAEGRTRHKTMTLDTDESPQPDVSQPEIVAWKQKPTQPPISPTGGLPGRPGIIASMCPEMPPSTTRFWPVM
ncbi:hypothetical protein POHY109586_19895 [Polaromonas hydrogenivorans]